MESIITPAEFDALRLNANRSIADPRFDPVPVVALRAADGPQIWLIAEIADDGDTAFGLCDLGVGCPETGEVSLKWLTNLRGPLRMPIERIAAFRSDKAAALSVQMRVAQAAGRIVV